MKKSLTKVLLLIMAMIMCLSAVGCSLFENVGNSGSIDKVPDYEPNFPNSSLMVDRVVFGEQEQSEKEYNKVKAVNKVARSVVGILYVYTDADGNEYYGGGSGVIVDISTIDINTEMVNESENEFYIITCAHVLDITGTFYVLVPDRNGRNFSDDDYDEGFIFEGKIGNEIYSNTAVTLVGADRDADIAVLKLDITGNYGGVTASDIVECKVAPDNYSISLGEDVFAIGNPSGFLPMTVSNGIVSYLDRKVLMGSIYMHLLQIDVQINHGNSGGALFNYYGELIGITNGGNESYDGINYTIPFKNVYAEDQGFVYIAKQLIASKTDTNYGYVSGRWNLGIRVTTAKHPETDASCLTIIDVEKNSNADKSGLKANDIITTVKYTIGTEQKEIEITSNSDFVYVLAEMKQEYTLGDSFVVIIERNGSSGYEKRSIRINLTEQFIFANTGR